MKGSKLPPVPSPKALLPPVAIGTKKQDKEKDLEGQGREKKEEKEPQQHGEWHHSREHLKDRYRVSETPVQITA